MTLILDDTVVSPSSEKAVALIPESAFACPPRVCVVCLQLSLTVQRRKHYPNLQL